MARNLTSGMEAATTSQHLMPVLFVEALFETGTVRMWSGAGTFSWGGADWIGAGNLLGLGAITETQEVRATGLDLSLSGIPSDMISLALSEPYQGRECRVFVGALDTNAHTLIADPYEAFRGYMDTMTMDEGAETATISVAVESRLIDLERPRERRYDVLDQQILWPNDKFFEYVSSIQNIEVIWGQS